MRQVYAVWRLQWGQGLREWKSAQSLGLSRLAVAEYVYQAQAAGLSWPLPTTYEAGAVAVAVCLGQRSDNARGPRLGDRAPRTQPEGGHLVSAVAGV